MPIKPWLLLCIRVHSSVALALSIRVHFWSLCLLSCIRIKALSKALTWETRHNDDALAMWFHFKSLHGLIRKLTRMQTHN